MADEALVEQILRAVELVPGSSVATYGDIASVVGIGPRHVGNVLARWGHGVPWWRVTNARGELPSSLLNHALQHWDVEGIPVHSSGKGCRLAECRADMVALETAWARCVTDILG